MGRYKSFPENLLSTNNEDQDEDEDEDEDRRSTADERGPERKSNVEADEDA